MDKYLLRNLERFNVEIFCINLAFQLFLFRTAIPVIKYPFLVLYFCTLLYFLIFKRNSVIGKLTHFARSLSLIFLLVLILILAFLFSDKLYLTIFKDIVNVLVLLSLFFVLSLSINSRKSMDFFVRSLIDLIIFFGFVISIAGLLDLFAIYSVNKSLDIDYNFALLPVFFGVIGVIYKLTENKSTLNRVFYITLLIIFVLQISLSGSRRGMLVLLFITGILLVTQLFILLNRKESMIWNLIRFRAGASLLAFFTLVIPALIFLILFHSTNTFKENFLDFLGTKNKSVAKYKISYNIYRYASVAGAKVSFPVLYQKIWSSDYDPKDPESGWATGLYKTVFPLTGDNAVIIPEGTKGCLIDSAYRPNIRASKEFSIKLVENLRVNSGDIFEASVYCYISKDFSGSSVKISADGSLVESRESEYRFFNPENSTGDSSRNLIDNGDFEQGTLFWIANSDSTIHQIVETPFGKGVRVVRNGGIGDWSLQYGGRPPVFYANHEYRFHFYYRVIQGGNQPFSIGWWVNDNGQGYSATLNLPVETRELQDGWKEATCSYRFKETHFSIHTFLNSFSRGAIAEFADIRLFDLDKNNSIPTFADEGIGTWQKLTIKSRCNDGKVSARIMFSADSTYELTSERGYIILAYPVYKVLSENDTLILPVSSDFRILNQKRDVTEITEFKKYQMAGFSGLNIHLPAVLNSDSTETDAVRRFTARLISEDTTYNGYHSDLSVDTVSNTFLGERLMRWQFAIQIFTKEYGLTRRLFGGGFNFLNWYSSYFNRDKTKSDYPHNPFLAILLYSGILGLSLYLLLILRTFYLYFTFFREYPILSFYFVIAFFFSFFSGGSPFDPPIIGFFIILPFLLDHINRKTLNVQI